ncbi:hypothetical protein AB1Y20_006100 [Prymnesium parvum]|uniref:RRM domain-containing protein n=1 Tax=Prymnesium parvum TaxID=97485 RepID=A0AB34J3W5_PRYPA
MQPVKDAAGHLEGYEVFIKYLPADTTADDLKRFFSAAGEVVGDARLMTHPTTGKCKGVGWVTFATEQAVRQALGWDGAPYGGRRLSISPATRQHTGFRPSVQPPGTHTPALLAEVVRAMVAAHAAAVVVDATFGRGGHSRGLLAALPARGALHAFDMDPEAVEAARQLAAAEPRLTIHHARFGEMGRVLSRAAVRPDAVFFDLGISSPQFDEAHRGFRLEADGPLDLRFDQSRGETAWQFLQGVGREELVAILHEYGETTDPIAARRIADAICLARQSGTLPRRTREFAALVASAKGREYQPMHPAKLTLQALRIHLNREFDEMRDGMRAAFDLLGEGGRIGLITWKHSECAIVVDFYRQHEAVKADHPLMRWFKAQGGAPLEHGWALEMDEAVRPSDAELQANSRSRSAILHVLHKRKAPRLAELERLAYPLLGWVLPAAAEGKGRASGGATSGGGEAMDGDAKVGGKKGKKKGKQGGKGEDKEGKKGKQDGKGENQEGKKGKQDGKVEYKEGKKEKKEIEKGAQGLKKGEQQGAHGVEEREKAKRSKKRKRELADGKEGKSSRA